MIQYENDDIVKACADLVGRSGSSEFKIGHLNEDVPVAEANWYAHATFVGARIMVDGHTSPANAAFALAQRLLAGAVCRCRQPVTLSDARPGCRWHLVGPRWEPGCDVESVHVHGRRGDVAAIRAALESTPPRPAKRRKRKKGK